MIFGVVVLSPRVAVVFFVGFIARGILAALLVIGLLVIAVARVMLALFFLMIRRRPRSTLFPYTRLFRSGRDRGAARPGRDPPQRRLCDHRKRGDRKSTRLNSSHLVISYAVFCLTTNRISRTLHVVGGLSRTVMLWHVTHARY